MIKSIQILRGLAALFVVFAHYEFNDFVVGNFGVDIFFIISGFIIAYMVNKDTTSFLYRRIIRIIPLYYSVTFLTIILAITKPQWFRNVFVSTDSILKSLAFIPYTTGKSGPILSLGWTLNLEMFFYFVTYLCINIFGQKKSIPACQIILLAFVSITQISKPDSYILYFLSQSIVIEFILGTALFYFWKNRNRYSNNYLLPIEVVLGSMALPFMVYADKYIEINRLIVFGFPALFLTNLFLILERKINFNNRIYQFFIDLGNASYAMYLVHPFVIYAFIRLIFTHFRFSNVYVSSLELIFTLSAVCMVSLFVHYFFEKPLLKELKSIFDKRFEKSIVQH